MTKTQRAGNILENFGRIKERFGHTMNKGEKGVFILMQMVDVAPFAFDFETLDDRWFNACETIIESYEEKGYKRV
jgi:hypothetical protein